MMKIELFTRDGLQPVGGCADLPELMKREDTIIWADIDDPANGDMDEIAQVLGFHPLAIEDTRNDYQRPKVEEYDDHVFIIINNLQMTYSRKNIKILEIDLFLGRNFVVTAHHGSNKCIEVARERLIRQGAFRHVSAEFVFYVILDVVVDGYFPALESLETQIYEMENEIINNPTRYHLSRVLELKRTTNEIVRMTSYQENMFGVITRHQRDLFFNHDILNYYLRDVHDHLIKTHSMSVSYADSLSTLVALYMSSTSNKLADVVTRLTVATIIIGIFTVFGGFYGMNFEQTWPPFDAPWGVPFVVMCMVIAAVGVYTYFKSRDLI